MDLHLKKIKNINKTIVGHDRWSYLLVVWSDLI